MARTTLDLEPTTLEALCRRAAREGKSTGQLTSELPARTISEPAEPPALPPLEWNSGSLGTPLVDLEDKEAVWAVLDGRA